jgi:hypothetical protein
VNFNLFFIAADDRYVLVPVVELALKKKEEIKRWIGRNQNKATKIG